MDNKKVMTAKSFLIGLLLSKILTTIGVALVASHFDAEITFLQYFAVLMLSGTAIGILSQVVIFAIYFFAIRLLANKARLQTTFYMLLVLLAVVYFTLITMIDWNLSKRRYVNFKDYLCHGNYFLIYAVVVISLLTIVGIKARIIINNNNKN